MGYITREVYVQRRGIENPIPYTRATNAQGIQFRFCDFHIPEGTEAKIYVQKPSGKAVYNNASIQGDVVTVEVTTQMFSELGTSNIQLQLEREGKVLVTFIQPVEVFQNYTEGDAPESQNESGFFESFVKETGEKAVRIAQEAADEIERRANEGEFTGTVTIGEVVTGEPGSKAAVENVGTAKDAVLNMTIPEGKTGKVENIDSVPVTFEEASDRENIESGETFPTLFGKIKKYFSGFKNIAFTGDYKDIHNAPPPTAVKGAKEVSYRTGDVNLTCANIGAIPTDKIVESTNITQEGFLMGGKTASENITTLKNNVNNMMLYSTNEVKIGAKQDGTPVYRKIIKTPMTNFVKSDSGYGNLSINTGVLIKELTSLKMFAVGGGGIYPLPYSGSGAWDTWLMSFGTKNSQTVMNFANRVAWGASYTLNITIEYTK